MLIMDVEGGSKKKAQEKNIFFYAKDIFCPGFLLFTIC